MASTPPLGPFAIAERVGTSVWLAEDTRTGKRVAVKLLTKSLPRDPAKRETFIREVRVAAALYHPFLMPVQEITAEGDSLLMVMEAVEGKPLTRALRGAPLGRSEFFRNAYQLGAALKYLHTKNILHGNITGDSVMVTPEGHLRLGGLNLNNLLRRDQSSKEYQQKGSDPRTVSYLAPEMISSQSMDERSDIFSYGVVLYEMATGRLPFSDAEAPDIARRIVESQPTSPRSFHPQIDAGVVSVLGGCLFKDAFKRHKEMKPVLELIEKLDAGAAEFATQIEKKGAPAPAASVPERGAILFVAEVAGFDGLAAQDPELAAKSAARMQQMLGESVYLFDGKVLDPFGARLIAEMPSVESALEAGRKAEFDLSPNQQDDERLDVHMLLHAGAVLTTDGVPVGPAIEKGLATLPHLTPNQLFISEAFVREGRGNVRLRDFGARAGVKLYTIVPAEPAPPLETEVEPSTAEIEAEVAAEVAAEIAQEKAGRRSRRGLMAVAIVAAIVLAILIGAGVMFFRRNVKGPETTAASAVSTGAGHPTAANPQTVHLADFTVEGTDPALPARAAAIRLTTEEILRSYPEVRIAPNADPKAASFSANVRLGANGPEILPTAGVRAASAPVVVPDVASGVRALVPWIVAETHLPARPLPAADVLNTFGTALSARAAGNDAATDASLRVVLTADPSFLPAQLVAMSFFDKTGKAADAVVAARQVATLDPSNIEASRMVARAALSAGDLQQAFAYYRLVLKRDPNDLEALNHIARYATSIGDTTLFTSTLGRLNKLQPLLVTAHEPDMLTAGGRIDVAMQRYYAIEETVANNPSLSLKIGRLAVLRHSLPIAEIELKKLAQSDPLYGFPMLSAYMAAEKRDKAGALAALDRALAASVPGDDAWTCAAEVHAILADTGGVLAALEKAGQRKEPTAAYVLAHPLFRYLSNDARFAKVRDTFTAQQAETRTALAQLR